MSKENYPLAGVTFDHEEDSFKQLKLYIALYLRDFSEVTGQNIIQHIKELLSDEAYTLNQKALFVNFFNKLLYNTPNEEKLVPYDDFKYFINITFQLNPNSLEFEKRYSFLMQYAELTTKERYFQLLTANLIRYRKLNTGNNEIKDIVTKYQKCKLTVNSFLNDLERLGVDIEFERLLVYIFNNNKNFYPKIKKTFFKTIDLEYITKMYKTLSQKIADESAFSQLFLYEQLLLGRYFARKLKQQNDADMTIKVLNVSDKTIEPLTQIFEAYLKDDDLPVEQKCDQIRPADIEKIINLSNNITRQLQQKFIDFLNDSKTPVEIKLGNIANISYALTTSPLSGFQYLFQENIAKFIDELVSTHKEYVKSYRYIKKNGHDAIELEVLDRGEGFFVDWDVGKYAILVES